MTVAFTPQAWDEYLDWLRSNPQILARIHGLIKDIKRNPYTGIGKPEPLKHALQG
jgi:toxin YoeB